MPLNRLMGPLGQKRAAHLLRRTCFGASRSEIDEFANLSATQAMNRLFNNNISDPPTVPIDLKDNVEWITDPDRDRGGNLTNRLKYILYWQFGNMIGHKVRNDKLAYIFRERLVYFFHTHFTTTERMSKGSEFLYAQIRLFRLFAFDADELPGGKGPRNFKQLTKKICVDNSMLRFLDGRNNRKSEPNENFAREFLELYTVGRGLEGHTPETDTDSDYYYYTEQDVVEGAKVFTGWDILDSDDKDELKTFVDPETDIIRGKIRSDRSGEVARHHTAGTKTLSNRMGSIVIRPKSGLLDNGEPTEASMLDEIDQFVEAVWSQPETAINICRKIYRFFVQAEIDENLRNDIIEEMAETFRNNEFKIQPVIKQLLESRHFYDGLDGTDGNFGSIVKSPVDLIAGFFRNFEMDFPDYNNQTEAYYHTVERIFRRFMEFQGQDFYNPTSVAGYTGYHQYPLYSFTWLNSSFLTERYEYIKDSIQPDDSDRSAWELDIMSYVRNAFSDVGENAQDLVKALAEYFLPVSDNLSYESSDGGGLSPGRMKYFLESLFRGGADANAERAWRDRWRDGGQDDELARQLEDLFNAMFQSPEYQLM